jgi:cytochrome c oxidase subunit 2
MVVLMTRRLIFALFLTLPAFAQQGETARPKKVIRILAERFTFSPSRIKVKQGTEVEFAISSDDTDHGFRMPDANIDVAIPQQGKGEVIVRFIANKKGKYVFECSRPCGAGHNLMRGFIIVE